MKLTPQKCLTIGLLSSLLIVCGEMIGAWAPSTPTGSAGTQQAVDWITSQLGSASMGELFAAYLSCYENMAAWQTGLGAVLGGIGIMLQFLGCFGLYLTFQDRESRLARSFFWSGCGYAFAGSLIHVVLCVWMYVYKLKAADPDCWSTVGDYTLWYVLPLLIVFYIPYVVFSVALFLALFQRKTPFPRWSCVLNPLIGKAVLSSIAKVLPASGFANAFSNANMGLSSVIIFAVFLWLWRKREHVAKG